MNSGLEGRLTLPIRVLVAGTSPWVGTVASGLEDRDGAFSVETATAGLDERPISADCVLTDDPDICAAVGDERPVLCAVDDADAGDIDALVADGAADVVDRTLGERPALLEHRIRGVLAGPSVETTGRDDDWYRSLVERASTQLVVLDDAGRVTYASPALEERLGLEAADLNDPCAFAVVHPADRDAVVEAFDAVCADSTGSTRTVTYRYRVDDDGPWHAHEAVLTNWLADPVVDGVIASIRDATRYHRVERELSDSFERITAAFYALDAGWRFTYVNERAEELLGRPREELLGNDVRELFPHGFESNLFDRFEEAMERQESISWERYSESLDIWMEIHVYPSETGLSVYFQDISERIEHERELAERTERLRMLVEHAPVIHYVIDDEGTVTLSTGRGLENIGFEPNEATGESFFELFEDYPEIRADAAAALEGEAVHSERRILDRVFESWHQPVVEDGAVVRVIGVAIDVTERVQYERALNALHEATSHLLTVDSKADACEYIVDVAADVLDLESILYRFDERANELAPAAHSPAIDDEIGVPPRLGPGSSIAWETFVTGSSSVFDDIRESELRYDEETDVRSGLYVPLGEHGVLVALSTSEREYDDDTVELAKLFAATAEAALDRIGQTQRLHDHEQELQEQNRHLERLDRTNRIRQEIEEHLLLADSREEIEQGICDRLAAQDSCLFAWIGEPDPSGNRIRSRATAGRERDYLDAITATTADDDAAEPTGRAGRSRAPVYVENVAADVHDGAWRTEALSRSFQSAYAVPLVHDGYLYGVLSVYGDERDAFCESFRSMLADLGETIAYAIDAVRRKNADLEEGVTEVELELATESALCRLATRLEARLSFEGATLRSDGSALVFVAVEPPLGGRELDVSVDGIDEAGVIAETESQTLLQLRLTDPFLGRIVGEYGAALRAFVCDDDGSRAVVNVPDGVEIREVLAELDRRGLSASLAARRAQPSTDGVALDAPARSAMLDQLTARQREVVQTAYYGGFFAWPRRTTGEELADSLEISPPAFHKHVRAVERKVFAALFEGTTTGG